MKKIVIIGGGIAGLSAGIYARKAGFEVEIYEKNQIAGGQCIGWNRKDHHIDNCIHWLTGTKQNTELRKLWEDIGALSQDTRFVENEKFYTTYIGDECVTLWKDLERTQRELLAISPEDEQEINTFINHVKYASCCEMPVKKPVDMMNLFDYIKLGRAMADMPKVLKEYGKINIKEMANRFKHPLLKALFSDYLPYEYQASSFIVSYATVVSGNGDIPAGGSLAMTKRMQDKFIKMGGRIFCNSTVKRIIVEGNRVTGIELGSGERIYSDYVICATDTMELFNNLIGKKYMNSKWENCYKDEENYPLFSGFQVAFSINKEVYPNTETVFFDCKPFELNGNMIERMSVKSYQYEPAFAPEGKTVLQANITQYDADYRYWKSMNKEDYRRKKYELAQTVEGKILEKFPELIGHIEFIDCWTPITYERYCNSYHGAFMSFITKKNVKSFSMKGIVKGLSNVYIASQWLQAPGGLPVAAATGKFAVQRILKKEKQNYII